MTDFIFGGLSALATVLVFGYWILRAVLVPRDEFDRAIKEIKDEASKRELGTLQEHNQMASKAELKELEESFAKAITKIEQGNRELSDKIDSVRGGLYWLVAKAGGKDELLEGLFRKGS